MEIIKDSTNLTSTNQQLEIELNEVTYAVINVKKNGNVVDNKIIEKLSSAVNVRLFLEGDQDFPFIKFDNFDSLDYEEKIFLYGTSGSGKSRALFELIRNVLSEIKRIYIINPRNNIADEYGKIPLRELLEKINSDDIVVWDNFPDDLIRRDVTNVKRILELLSSKYVRKLIIVLKPKYLEVFRELPKQNPEFFTYEITYSKEQFKTIIQQYGTNIPQFRTLYEKYISPNLEKISRILWNIEPIPLKILDYYNTLKEKSIENNSVNLDGIKEAETLLRSTNYYQHQFGLLNGMNERKSDVEFLCILKMCYELGINRSESNISKLQLSIFGSESPKQAFKNLSSWVYISGQDYAMHDASREAVNLSDYVKMKMLTYISENFDALIGTNSEQSINLLGLFIGRNIEFVPLKNSSNGFLPDIIYSQMKKKCRIRKINRSWGGGSVSIP
ncbi:Hypothetical protein Nlim_1068 [Candidatus Nitrosarchaeum limnium SFB1]|uniref:Helicase superfamily 3 single-stranded DNA/RNA virus domain-containing protein n=1 Tax=Candidatus Nitrosarchaeum limnium SFB1 TaxID=886738 RepID=F3KKP4_9ARCH|nr:Hypothetical protein Nlim_1068 [Candidatus Nitrosarchaeum limnium SFB1]